MAKYTGIVCFVLKYLLLLYKYGHSSNITNNLELEELNQNIGRYVSSPMSLADLNKIFHGRWGP